MSKRGENIYKRKDGRWEGRYIKEYNINGKSKYGYIYAKTYSEAKVKLSEAKFHSENGLMHKNNKNIAYADVLAAWLQSVRINVKESTYVRYIHIINRHIVPCLGSFAVNKISTQLVGKMIETKLIEGRLDKKGGLSPKTVTDILTIIKGSFDYAKLNGFETICNLKNLTVKKKVKEMRVLNAKEQNCLTEVLLDEMDLSKLGVLLCLHTGIRIGELCALRWENICIHEKTLKIRETMQRIQNKGVSEKTKTKIIITEPKSKNSIRDIPLPDFLIDIIAHFQNSPKAFILTGDKNKFIEPRTMQNHFKAYIKHGGIAKANFHSLRHTFATRCVEIGFEIKSLSEILGHANVNITLNKYVHSSFELKSNNMNKLTLVA